MATWKLGLLARRLWVHRAASPIDQPTLARTSRVSFPQHFEVLSCFLDQRHWLLSKVTRDEVGEPKASQLVTGHSLSSVTECFNVCSAYPTMAPGRHEGKVATVAEIHDVLTRRIEDFGGLPR